MGRILLQQSHIDLGALSIHYMTNVNAEILCYIMEVISHLFSKKN